MDFSNISDEVLLARTQKLAQTERKLTHVILCHINEVENRRLYLQLDCTSMYRYLTKHLGYSEDQAYARINAAKVLKQVPEIAEKIESGALNLTQLTHVQKCIRNVKADNPEGKKELTEQVLEKIENKNGFDTLKVLAVEFNQPVVNIHKVKPQQDDSVRVESTYTQEEFSEIKLLKDLLSHVVPDGNLSKLFVHLAKKEIRRLMGKDVLEDQSAAQSNVNESPKEIQGEALSNDDTTTQGFWVTRKRGPMKITTKRSLLKKANGCCEYHNPQTGQRCRSRYQLQIDHRVPLALGGSEELHNLRVLCRTHNLSEARRNGLSRK